MRRARQRVALGAGDALGQQLLLQAEHGLAVLGMDHGKAPSSRQREKLWNMISSSIMSAPLYAMKCLKLLTPRSRHSAICCGVRSFQPVMATWKP